MHGRARLTLLRLAVLSAGAPVLAVAGCASAVDVAPAPHAADPACARVMVALREAGFAELADRPRRDTSAQSTAAWGDPPVVLRCGVEPPGPTTDACLRVDSVDWVVREDDEQTVFTTYGRVPAVEVSVPASDPAGADVVLAGLGGPVSGLPQVAECL